MRLRPGTPVLLRGPGAVQLGSDPATAIRLDGLSEPQIAALSALAEDGSAGDRPGRVSTSGRIGALPRRVTAELRRRGALVDAPASRHADEDAWTAARADGRGDTSRIRRRAAAVGVCGLGRTGLLVARSLAAAGIGAVVVDDDLTVGPYDVSPGGYTLRDVGTHRRAAAARLLREAGTRVGVGARTDLDAVVVVTGGALDVARTWQLMGDGIPHLPVAWEGPVVTVGPLVIPGTTACLRCVDLHRRDDDPAWPVLAAQVARRGRHLEETVLALTAAASALRALTALVDTDEVRGPFSERFSLTGAPATTEHWPVHPECGCVRLPDAGRARSR